MAEDGPASASEITRENTARGIAGAELQFDRGGAENVPGAAINALHLIDDSERFMVRPWLDKFNRGFGVFGRVKGQGGLMFRITMSVGLFGVFFLKPGRVHEHHRQQIGGRRCAVNLAAETIFGEHRKVAAMVDMSMTENYRGNTLNTEGQSTPVALSQLLQALKQPAVEEDRLIAVADQVFRAGHRTGGPQKLQRRFAGNITLLSGHHSILVDEQRDTGDYRADVSRWCRSRSKTAHRTFVR